jgi:hypothetical protein
LLRRLTEGDGASRDIVVEAIDGAPAMTSALAAALSAAGLRATPSGLRYYSSL